MLQVGSRWSSIFLFLNERKFLIALFMLFIAIALISKFMGVVFLFFIGAVSMIYKRKFKGLPIGLEFVTVTTIVVSKSFGPLIGAIYGLATSITAQMVSTDYDAGMIFFFISSMLIGAIAYFIPFQIIVVIATMSIFSDFFTQFPAIMGRVDHRLAAGVYAVTHLIINMTFWKIAGPILLLLVGSNL